MNISIKKMAVEMEVKNTGIEFEIRTPQDDFLGDLIINKKGLIWCEGKKSRQNGKQKDWEEILKFFNED